jgi:hypothetical protein
LQTSLAAGAGLTLAGGSTSQADVLMSVPRAVTEANPPARPGRVRWHADFAAACAAAGRSSKPVLLFHMLGRLDQRFC